MKKILLWDPRFPGRAPQRLEVDDVIASACVRATVAAAADPAEAGALGSGGALSAADPVTILIQHGPGKVMRRVTVPDAVAVIAVATGLAAYTSARAVVAPAYPQIASSAKLRIAGDSIFGRGRFGASPGTGIIRQLDVGGYEYALASKPRFNFEGWPKDNSGEIGASPPATYNGTTTWVDGGPGAGPGSGLDYHTFLIPRTIAMAPAVLAESATVNSRADPSAVSKLIAIFDAYANAGIYVCAGIMPAVLQGASFDDASYQANRPTINAAVKAWVTAAGPAKALLLDWDEVLDPGRTGYCTVPSYLLADGVHPSTLGASALGNYINSRFDLITADPDLFEQRWNGLTNLLPNPQMLATVSGLSTGSRSGSWESGSAVPAGGRCGGTAGTSTILSTYEANAQTGGNNIVCPIVPISTSTAEEVFTFFPNAGPGGNGFLASDSLAGKYVVFAAEIEVVSTAPFIGTPTLYCVDNLATATNYARAMDIDSSYGNTSARVAGAQTFKLMTDPVLLSSGAAGTVGPRMQALLRCQGAAAFAAGQGAMTVKVKRVALWDVGAPKPRWNA